MQTPMPLTIRLPLFGTAVVLLAVGIWWVTRRPASPPLDPPALTASETGFFGSAKCGECHDEQLKHYLDSGHAKTFWSTRDFPFRDRFGGLKFADSERSKTYRYFLAKSGVEVTVPGKFGGDRFPLQFAFGSGEHAISFVTLTPDGSQIPVGIEHRVSWFTGQDQAGLTPGQFGRPVDQDIEDFGRIIRGTLLERCFGCHTTSGSIEGDQLVDLMPNVGCESCHTGSAPHWAAMQVDNSADSDDGFEQRPWRTADQIQICAECHRGEDAVETSEITRENPKIVRFQPVGLVQSKCYLQSGQRLLCSTCHDPHQHAAQRTTVEYEQKCLQCHSTSTNSVRCSVSADSGCVSCHMPRVEVHPSISFHDHWIRIRDENDPPAVQDVTDDQR